MQSAENGPPPEREPATTPEWPVHPEIEARQSRNLLVLAAHQIVFRVGWIFKTESVIMPAFMDAIAGAGWLRGCLPVLNRFGQSIPPVFCAARLRAIRYKRVAMTACIMSMCLPFGVLALTCFAVDERKSAWVPGLFLGLYFFFFICNGLYAAVSTNSFGSSRATLRNASAKADVQLLRSLF